MSESLATTPAFVGATIQQRVSWQQAMKSAIRTPTELARRLALPEDFIRSNLSFHGIAQFPIFVPLEFLRRIEHGNPNDPLFRQVWPWSEESLEVPGYSKDPVGEQNRSLWEGKDTAGDEDVAGDIDRKPEEAAGESLSASPQSRLLLKYRGRALLIAHQACGIHCRYCFRRHFPYQESTQIDPGLGTAVSQIAAMPDIREVILSGGDPLVLTDNALMQLLEKIEAIPHIQRLRIHSRMPVVIPQRSTTELIARLRKSRLTTWLVIHCNHANELDLDAIDWLSQWIDAGIPVMNQAVLLSGVNDTLDALEQLCERLIDIRIQPYYLHQLDRVLGASHFEVERLKGIRLIAELRKRLPGYAIPTLVCEEPGKPSKTPLNV